MERVPFVTYFNMLTNLSLSLSLKFLCKYLSHQHTHTHRMLDVLDRGSSGLPEASALSVITVVIKVFINLCLDAPPKRISQGFASLPPPPLLHFFINTHAHTYTYTNRRIHTCFHSCRCCLLLLIY